MKVAYIILVHKNPQQVKRLIGSLRHVNVSFYLHVDKKVDSRPFHAVLKDPNDKNVFFVGDRAKVYLYGFGIVQATLNAMRKIQEINAGGDLDYVFLISGQDYPIKTNDEIFAFLDRNYGKEFISYTGMPTSIWFKSGMNRIEEYHLYDVRIGHRLRRLANAILPRRRFLDGFTPYGGATWWCLTYKCVVYLLDFVRNNKKFMKFFKYTHIPDEMFFQTIILNSPFAKDAVGKISGAELGDDQRYLRWSHEYGGAHPEILRKEDLAVLVQSDKLFARKFDMDVDSVILDLIDGRRSERSSHKIDLFCE